VLGLFEDEGEGVVELLVRAEPYEFAGAYVDLRLEFFREFCPGARIQPVGGDDEVIFIGIFADVFDIGFEA
jgi:hypothetical protein